MGLLHYFLSLRKSFDIEIFVAHVDHMLRGKTSLEDRQFVENFCKEKGVPVFSTSIPIPKLKGYEDGQTFMLTSRLIIQVSKTKLLMQEKIMRKLSTSRLQKRAAGYNSLLGLFHSSSLSFYSSPY
ncbi:tRNA(Ile)-lysidine synthase [Ureibacillus acetophenoni]